MVLEAFLVKKNEPNWLVVLRTVMPLGLSYIPIGLACGVLLHAAGFNHLLTALISVMVFSGGAQFLIASMLTINAPMTTIILMMFFLELRYALLGSSLSRYLKGQSLPFIFTFAFSMNDENYAVNYLKFATDKHWKPSQALLVEHYSLLFWTVSNIVGSLIGSALTINLQVVDFALTALFIYMAIMQTKSRLIILVAISSGVLTIGFLVLMKSTLGLVVSTLLASLTGYFIERYLLAHKPESHLLYKVHDPTGPAAMEESDK
ncbi:AzlC family ABC transporter permease [Lactiplantibacillus pentosus]